MANYKELPVYAKAYENALKINDLICGFPSKPQAWAVSRQLFGAACSIGANIAESRGRYVGKEYERFLTFAQGSANEVEHWLRLCRDCSLADGAEADKLLARNEEVLRMISATLRSLREKRINGET